MISDKEMNKNFFNWQFFEIKDFYIRIQEPLYRDITEGGGGEFHVSPHLLSGMSYSQRYP